MVPDYSSTEKYEQENNEFEDNLGIVNSKLCKTTVSDSVSKNKNQRIGRVNMRRMGRKIEEMSSGIWRKSRNRQRG